MPYVTQKEINERQKYLRLVNGNINTKRYEKTHKGFLVRLYRNMKSRILGIQKQKFNLYEGKTLLDKNDFYRWAFESKDFIKLFSKWENSKYNRKLTPTVDRVNPNIGYEIGNIQWITHSENSRRGGKHKWEIYHDPPPAPWKKKMSMRSTPNVYSKTKLATRIL